MISDRIKDLRELNNMTQAELARQLGITRSSVNAWEIGISVPSTQYIVELAQTFGVSTDYLLCVESTATISVSGLDEDDLRLVSTLVNHLKQKNLKS
ncbi:MAG: helix-turn-helix transcriptional regulator [Ruminococcaceae bacterium]|nr:helix-turn-helix transcriptional regulator [Oscillospiraceae bacterium]